MNFVAIDFETANYTPTSACAVGLAIVRKAKIVDTYYTLIKPEPFWFLSGFTELHGISAKDVKKAKTFEELWPELRELIHGEPLLAHNAPFDRTVLKSCLNLYGLRLKQPEFYCSLRIAREAFPKAKTNKLPAVCRRLKIPLNHHQAKSDAVACAKAAIHICKSKGIELDSGKLKPIAWR